LEDKCELQGHSNLCSEVYIIDSPKTVLKMNCISAICYHW